MKEKPIGHFDNIGFILYNVKIYDINQCATMHEKLSYGLLVTPRIPSLLVIYFLL